MGFYILTKVLSNYNLTIALFDAQTLSYRKILVHAYRNTRIPKINVNNNYYTSLETSFNNWDAAAIEFEFSNNTDLAKAVNCVVKFKGKRPRQAKKNSTRVMREVNRMWKQGFYNSKDLELKKALVLIHKAFREAFINIRKVLTEDIYNCIPDNLTIDLKGSKQNIKSLYYFDASVGKYRLRSDIKLSPTDLRKMQLTIVPYVFEKIYGKYLYGLGGKIS